ncbi:hypothetical protein JZO66_10015 [Enterococcus sp. DIV0242_7C1]|uniref:Uncharacterized protein n=1 Tax=Candidatus Enterococcus dunnyi TaxID=1834192 RepID=A0A200J924_9ENTE|nr:MULTISPECIES: hypothetical protein [unclassified Enterococcus]MBO0470882.1 hypothetical protein [Enterococcus sp. DIV0242_7C1]OUZ33329.1 hypothetical protein A5889_002040 [Enterococcus sp. 9D6_DIV0238]
MKTIIFTKKHIVITIVLFFLLALMIITVWFTGISAKQAEVGKIQKDIQGLESEVAALRQTSQTLSGKKNLLDSAIVKELPRFSKGIQIQEYLSGLEQKVAKNKIQLKQITAEDTLLFSSSSDPTKKVYSSKIVLDYSAAGKNELFQFIQALENDQRFIKVTDYSYTFGSEEGEQSTFESTLLFNLYYLNVEEEKE